MPKAPVPFGSHTLYEKPEKTYDIDYYRKLGAKGPNKDFFVKQQLREQMAIVQKR